MPKTKCQLIFNLSSTCQFFCGCSRFLFNRRNVNVSVDGLKSTNDQQNRSKSQRRNFYSLTNCSICNLTKTSRHIMVRAAVNKDLFCLFSRERLIHQKLQIENCSQFPLSMCRVGGKVFSFPGSVFHLKELKILCDMKIAFHLAFSVLNVCRRDFKAEFRAPLLKSFTTLT